MLPIRQRQVEKMKSEHTIFTIDLWLDQDAENPCDYGLWKFVSFNNRNIGYESPYNYLSGRDKFGEFIPANIGIARKLKTGTAFIVSCYEHGVSCYSLLGEGTQCRWDTTLAAGILLLSNPKELKPKDREESARRFLEIYTNWANGWIYGFSIEVDGELIDGCGGFDDAKYMFEEITEVIKSHIKENGIEEYEIRYAGEAVDLSRYHSVEI
jgi:hypothetical protein